VQQLVVMAEGGPQDPRLQYISDRVCTLLRSKDEFFRKLADAEEGEVIRNFVNSDSVNKLFFTAGAKDIAVYETIPPNYKKKVAFVLKTKEAKIDEKDLSLLFNQIVVGDLNSALLEGMHGVMRNVYLPIISNPRNTQGWPEVAMKAFADKYHHTLAAVVVAIGQTRGKTLLALPPGEMLGGANKDRQDKDRVHILESAVVMWTERINMALSRNSDSVFANNQNPGPAACLEFWTSKMIDLGEILEQLNGPQIGKVLKVLDIIRSPYYQAFKALISQLQVAHAESKDNCKYLAALKVRASTAYLRFEPLLQRKPIQQECCADSSQ
jgi:dynein heavy chain